VQDERPFLEPKNLISRKRSGNETQHSRKKKPRFHLSAWLDEHQEIPRQKVPARNAFDDEFSQNDIESVSFDMGATTTYTTHTPLPDDKGRKRNSLEEKGALIAQALQQTFEEEDIPDNAIVSQTTSSQEPQNKYISVVESYQSDALFLKVSLQQRHPNKAAPFLHLRHGGKVSHVDSFSAIKSATLVSQTSSQDETVPSFDTSTASTTDASFVHGCSDSAVEDIQSIEIIPEARQAAQLGMKRCGRSELVKSSTTERRSVRAKVSRLFEIPDYSRVAPILQQLGFSERNGRYFLPNQCWKTEEAGIAYFDSTDELRKDLCQKGVPTSAEILLSNEDFGTLWEWVRYSIVVPFLAKDTLVPDLHPLDGKDFRGLLKNLGGKVTPNFRFYVGDKKFEDQSECEDYLTRFGLQELPAFSQCKAGQVANNEYAIRLALFVLENRRVDFWWVDLHFHRL
jgi:hypothetical protein